MARAALAVCSTPGCPNLTPGGQCESCTSERWKRTEQRRGNATDRGYGREWKRKRDRFLRSHTVCIDCPARATVADHDPVSRRDLVARGEVDPDADRFLKPRCKRCHDRRTAREQPGGWNQ